MNKIATNIEQSRHLIELGLDPNTADCYWWYADCEHYLYTGKILSNDILPAWSLTALLNVIPKRYESNIQKSPITGQYFVHVYFGIENPTHMTKDYDSPIDAAYEMVCWLLEQGLIKKGDNDENTSKS